jgi:2'-5' RNA ligase
LQFLGDIEPMLTIELDRLARSVASDLPPFQCTLDRVGAFPRIDRARVVWVGGDVPEGYRQLSEGLSAGLAELGFARARRETVTHATLARVKDRPDPKLVESIEGMNPLSPIRFTVDRLALMESVLTPRGAEYAPLFTCVLGEER